MMKMSSLMIGDCIHCRTPTRDTLGSERWPDKPELAEVLVWVCLKCDAEAESDGKGSPIGFAADQELRRARRLLDERRIAPLYLHAHHHPSYAGAKAHEDPAERIKRLAIIKNAARRRVFRFLADRLAIPVDECHVAMFDLGTCRVAWLILQHVSYDDIRRWDKENPAPQGEDAKGKRKVKGDRQKEAA